jgi:hypothetical protein
MKRHQQDEKRKAVVEANLAKYDAEERKLQKRLAADDWKKKYQRMLLDAGKSNKADGGIHEVDSPHDDLRVFMPLLPRKVEVIERLISSEEFKCPGGAVDLDTTFVIHYLHDGSHFSLVSNAFETKDGLMRLVFDDLLVSDGNSGYSELMSDEDTLKMLGSKKWRVTRTEVSRSSATDLECTWRDRVFNARVHLPWIRQFRHQCLDIDEADVDSDPNSDLNRFDGTKYTIQTCAPDTAMVGRWLLGHAGAGDATLLSPFNEMYPSTLSVAPDSSVEAWSLADMRAAFVHGCVGARLLHTWPWWKAFQDEDDRMGHWDVGTCLDALDWFNQNPANFEMFKMKGHMTPTQFKDWTRLNPSPGTSSKLDRSYEPPAAKTSTPKVTVPPRATGRQTPSQQQQKILSNIAPAALISAWYGGDVEAIKADADGIEADLTYISVFAGSGSLKGSTIILAKRLKAGDVNITCLKIDCVR